MALPKNSALKFTEITYNIAIPYQPENFICFVSSEIPNVVNNPKMKYGIRTSDDVIWYNDKELKIKPAWFTIDDKFFNDYNINRHIVVYTSHTAMPLDEFHKKDLIRRVYHKKFKEVWPFKITFDIFNDEIILNTHKSKIYATFKLSEHKEALSMCTKWSADASILNEKLELFKYAFKRK